MKNTKEIKLLSPYESLKKKKPTTTNVGCREKGILIHCLRECKLVQTLWKTIWRLL
jgi:hypothetical protein